MLPANFQILKRYSVVALLMMKNFLPFELWIFSYK